MPLCNLLLQNLVNQLVLLDHCQALELRRFDFDRVHGAATAADVLDLGVGSTCRSHNVLCVISDATGARSTLHCRLAVHASCAPSLTMAEPADCIYSVIDDVHLNTFAHTVRQYPQASPQTIRQRTSSFVGSSSPLILLNICNSASFRKSGGSGAPFASAL